MFPGEENNLRTVLYQTLPLCEGVALQDYGASGQSTMIKPFKWVIPLLYKSITFVTPHSSPITTLFEAPSGKP